MNALGKIFSEDKLIFSFSDTCSGRTVPMEWRNFGIKDNLKNSAWYPPKWEVYANRLPWVHRLLKKCLIGTAVFYIEHPLLIYIFHDSANYYFYTGKPPLGYLHTDLKEQRHKIPGDIFNFYQELHNGFTFYPVHSMGLLPLEEQPELRDLYDGFCPALVKDAIGIFHNGAGDYLSIRSSSNSQNAFIWWHEEPEKPETPLDFWAIMDNWMSIFLEDSLVFRD